jgi:hypothetical protein
MKWKIIMKSRMRRQSCLRRRVIMIGFGGEIAGLVRRGVRPRRRVCGKGGI